MKSKNVLLIDDDEDDQLIYTDAINEVSSELTCISVQNGLEALKLLRTVSELPAIIFLDLNMPLMNGFDFLGKIKKDDNFRHIPVVILTTSDSPVDKKIARNLGAAKFITKTPEFKFLKEQLVEILTGVN